MDPKTLNLIIESFVPVISNFMSWLGKVRAESQRTKEWTEEEKADNQAAIDKLGVSPEVWQQVQPL